MATILIVKDSLYQRRKIRRALEMEGYKLLEASNGQEGLNLTITDNLDCILLDLLLPVMRGIELLQVLHDQEITIPIVVVTADIQDSTRQQCLEPGATAFLNKPWDRDELTRTVAQVLDATQTKGEASQ